MPDRCTAELIHTREVVRRPRYPTALEPAA